MGEALLGSSRTTTGRSPRPVSFVRPGHYSGVADRVKDVAPDKTTLARRRAPQLRLRPCSRVSSARFKCDSASSTSTVGTLGPKTRRMLNWKCPRVAVRDQPVELHLMGALSAPVGPCLVQWRRQGRPLPLGRARPRTTCGALYLRRTDSYEIRLRVTQHKRLAAPFVCRRFAAGRFSHPASPC